MAKITYEEASNLERERNDIKWTEWFCPASGKLGCFGPACSCFIIRPNRDPDKFDKKIGEVIKEGKDYSYVSCDFRYYYSADY